MKHLEAHARRVTRRWGRLLLWAARSNGGKVPRHKRCVLRFAGAAIEAEMALYLWHRSLSQDGL